MSIAMTDRLGHQPIEHGPAPRRVRQQARDAVALMAFSAATSLGLATVLLLLTNVTGLG
jgi:hypothetical protein